MKTRVLFKLTITRYFNMRSIRTKRLKWGFFVSAPDAAHAAPAGRLGHQTQTFRTHERFLHPLPAQKL